MSRAGQILERLERIAEDDDCNAEVYVKPEDTIIRNQSLPDGIVPQCSTCGRDVVPGFLTPSLVQCPKCMDNIDLARGNYKYRTLSGNRKTHDGVPGDANYM